MACSPSHHEEHAVGLIVSVRLGDRYGRRPLFVTGLAAVGIRSPACGPAAEPGHLAECIGMSTVFGMQRALLLGCRGGV